MLQAQPPGLITIIITSTVIAAIVAFISTLIGTWRQNKAQDKRLAQQLEHNAMQAKLEREAQAEKQAQQLEHDANQRRLEREMKLRRDVYLEAAVSLSKLQEHLTSFASFNLSYEQHQGQLVGVWAPLYQVSIIGTLDTISALQQLYRSFTDSLLKLHSAKLELSQAQAEAKNYQERLHNVSVKHQELFAAIQYKGALATPLFRLH
jgi:predicted Holliday junction resolvase-like endonuclease